MSIIRPPAWMDDADCQYVDPELFFPEKGGSTREAKAICASCPVWSECRDYAVTEVIPFGIWGQTSERDRRQIRNAALREAA